MYSQAAELMEKYPNAVKLVAVVWRKPGMTHEEFKEHYENVHIPLLLRNLPNWVMHQRSYNPPSAHQADLAVQTNDAATFDVITQVWFRDAEHHQALIDAQKDPAIAAEIAADEELFCNRSRSVYYVADEEWNIPGVSG